MALGGGTFLVQNKILPGTYINFVSAARASATLSDRGYGALPLQLDWGPDGEVFTVDTADFQKESRKIFGFEYTHDKLKPVRDFFKNARVGYFYRLNSGEKATCDLARAKRSGVRGNDITLVVRANVDEPEKLDVLTLLGGKTVDSQTVAGMNDLADNDWVTFIRTAALEPTAGTPMTGGTNGEVTGGEYQDFLDKVEQYSFNTLGCPSTTPTVIDLFVAFTKRMRDEAGVKFQTVVFNKAANHEGVINLKNKVLEDENEAALVYWMTGASAGCEVNKSNTNKIYDGEYTVFMEYKQRELEAAIVAGELVFHKVDDTVRILDDVNSFTSVTLDKNADFQSNQTIRVLDQIGNDIAVLFNDMYLGKVPNDESGRITLWKDIVSYHRQLLAIRAITNFDPEDIVVEKGIDKKSVAVTNTVEPVNAMTKLYMTVVVR